MKNKSLEEISSIYELEIERIVETIKKEKANKILLQFPEGMKPFSLTISDFISEKANCECFIWLDSCFGACDVPIEVERLGIDLIIQFGHSNWNYPKNKIKEL